MRENHKYFSFRFTHIPKCGGTSFRAYLNQCALDSGIAEEELYIPGFNNVPNEKNISQLNERELEELKKRKIKVFAGHTRHNEFNQYDIKLNHPFNFTILRNPIDRFISHYNFFNYKLGYNDCKDRSLNDLEPAKREWIINRLSNTQTHYIADIKQFRKIGYSSLLKIAKYNLEHEYHLVGILEKIDQTLFALKEKSPNFINFNSELQIHNKGVKDYEIMEVIKNEILEANYLDLELYKFGQTLIDTKHE